MQMQGPILEPQCDIYCPSMASQIVGKMPKFSIFSGDSTQKEEVSFKQWTFEIKSVMQKSHGSDTVGRNSMVIILRAMWLTWFGI